jgi:hypothetical protein
MLAHVKWHTISWRTGTKGKLKARFAAVRVRVADGPPQRIRDKGQQHLLGGKLAHRRTQDVGREEILSRQPAGKDRSAHLGGHHQGTMNLRAGSPAAERRTRSRSLRGPILARPASSCAHVDDRLRFPPVSPAQNSKAGKKNQRATASTDIARRTSGHRRTHRSATTATMPALQKMDLQRKAA